MRECPKCKSADIHHSRAKSKWETWRKGISGKRPYRCRVCGWRGWGVETGPRVDDEKRNIAERAIVLEPPNLKSSMLATEPRRWDEVDLRALDLSIDADAERSS